MLVIAPVRFGSISATPRIVETACAAGKELPGHERLSLPSR